MIQDRVSVRRLEETWREIPLDERDNWSLEKGEREVPGFLKHGEVYPAVYLMLKKIKRHKEKDSCEFLALTK